MKIEFDDKSYVECNKAEDKVILTICARDRGNSLKKISNSVEITIEEFYRLISELVETE
jgi:hypothetical protein